MFLPMFVMSVVSLTVCVYVCMHMLELMHIYTCVLVHFLLLYVIVLIFKEDGPVTSVSIVNSCNISVAHPRLC